MPKPFNRVAGLNPGRSVFDLSYEKKFTCDMGQLIPIVCDEVVPGDVLSFGNQIVVRFQPLVAPMLHEVNVYVHYFFVPYRLLMDDWEDFLSGGVNGDKSLPLPRWTVTDQDIAAGATAIGSIWDYIGCPLELTIRQVRRKQKMRRLIFRVPHIISFITSIIAMRICRMKLTSKITRF